MNMFRIFLLIPFIIVACGKSDELAHTSSVSSGVDCRDSLKPLNTERLDAFGIDIHDFGISSSEKARHLNELNSMPDFFLSAWSQGDGAIYLTSGSITEFEQFSHLKGVTPRGWESTGCTWDDIPGSGGKCGTFLGNSALPNGPNSLAIHEATHNVDLAHNYSSRSTKLNELFEKLKLNQSSNDSHRAYRFIEITEFLAIGIDEYYCNDDTNEELKTLYPEFYDFIANDFESDLNSYIKN